MMASRFAPAVFLFLAGTCAAAPLPAEERRRADPDVQEALRRGGGTSSVHDLVPRASAMAREWSPGAALYSALGHAPRNARLWEPDKWTFVFGDPGTRDGSFEVVYHDGALHTRSGVREEVRMKEFFKAGKFESRRASLEVWTGVDYEHCSPVSPEFLDAPELLDRLRELKLRPASMRQYRMALLNPVSDQCDGLGYLSQFIIEKPIPKRLRKRTLWIVSGEEETLFLHPTTGRVLLRRRRAEPKPPERPVPAHEGQEDEGPTLVPIKQRSKGWAPLR